METPFGLFGKNWTSKTEYLYVDLGRITQRFEDPAFPESYTVLSRVTEPSTINTPVVAKY